MKVIVCGGGPVDLVPKDLQADYFIGADSGAVHLLQKNIMPNYITGDLDSIRSEDAAKWKDELKTAVKVPAEKDETDTFLALQKAAELAPKQIELIGVTGGRLDHYHAVLHDLLFFQKEYPSIRFSIRDQWNVIRFLTPGQHQLTADGYQYCSFYAFEEDVTEVTLKGFKYPVQKEDIQVGSSRFTSNEIIAEFGSIEFSSGICLCIQSREESGE